jgi:hypothetical protein
VPSAWTDDADMSVELYSKHASDVFPRTAPRTSYHHVIRLQNVVSSGWVLYGTGTMAATGFMEQADADLSPDQSVDGKLSTCNDSKACLGLDVRAELHGLPKIQSVGQHTLFHTGHEKLRNAHHSLHSLF